MNQADLINDLLKRTDGSLEQLKLHYGPLIRYVITPILPDARDREEVFSDIQKLKDVGLDVPQARELQFRLSENGISFENNVLLEDDCVEAIKKLF